MMKKFKAPVLKFVTGLWSYGIIVPQEPYDLLTKEGNKRILCSINKHNLFHAGFMPDGNGKWFIKLNKEKIKNFKLEVGEIVSVEIKSDTSKYGMELPREFEEVLIQDIEGSNYFEKLTDGKKRSLIFLIAKVKNTDKKITKSLIILDHLKANSGELDFKLLNVAFKENNRF
jgi:hypothetical protein